MAETATGIGARLRAGREKMGLTQLQAAEKLHVDAKVVESLEAERFDSLGAPVFVRGHLKHYAELTNEQAAELLELYSAATKPVLPDLTKLPKAAPDTKPSRLAVPALVILIAFVMVGIVWWVAKSVTAPATAEGDKPKHGPQPVAIAPDVAQEAAAAEAAANEAPPGAGPDDTTAPNTVAKPSPIAAANNARAKETPPTPRATGAGVPGAAAPNAQPGNVPRGPAGAGGAPSPIAAANKERSSGDGAGTQSAPTAAGTAVPSAAAAAPRAGKPMEVTLRFAADSWVEVYDANGQKLFYDVGSASSSHTVSGTPPFRVTVANAPGVTLDVNGKPATVPANALKGDEAQFVINRSGRIVRAAPKADGG
jgi:cytoskeleton protein RodZ